MSLLPVAIGAILILTLTRLDGVSVLYVPQPWKEVSGEARMERLDGDYRIRGPVRFSVHS